MHGIMNAGEHTHGVMNTLWSEGSAPPPVTSYVLTKSFKIPFIFPTKRKECHLCTACAAGPFEVWDDKLP